MKFSNPVGEVSSEAYTMFTPDQLVSCLPSLGRGRLGVVSTSLDSNMASWNRFLATLVTERRPEGNSQMGHLGIGEKVQL